MLKAPAKDPEDALPTSGKVRLLSFLVLVEAMLWLQSFRSMGKFSLQR